MPNNEGLPVLIFRRAFRGEELADRMEAPSGKTSGPPSGETAFTPSTTTIPTAHEVLGFAAGSARLTLGGEGGHDVTAEAGDILVLPVGTGHFLVGADPALLVIGAYPVDQHWDICRSAPDAATLNRMLHLPFPASDPVTGKGGDLVRAWPA